jgi:DNA-binding MarR family transcriptional regulator
MIRIFMEFAVQKSTTASRRAADATNASTPVAPGSVQPYQRQGPVNLARRVSQILLGAVREALPQDSLRNEFGALVAIANLPGLEQKKLATALALDATSIGQIVDELERKGLVRRVGSPTDRRVKHVEVSPAGQRHIAEYRPKVLQAQAEVLAVLSAQERRTLIDLMVRVIEANARHDRPGAGRRSPKPKSG